MFGANDPKLSAATMQMTELKRIKSAARQAGVPLSDRAAAAASRGLTKGEITQAKEGARHGVVFTKGLNRMAYPDETEV